MGVNILKHCPPTPCWWDTRPSENELSSSMQEKLLRGSLRAHLRQTGPPTSKRHVELFRFVF